jgi:hypothetical protein
MYFIINTSTNILNIYLIKTFIPILTYLYLTYLYSEDVLNVLTMKKVRYISNSYIVIYEFI